MKQAAAITWSEANQAYLARALSDIKTVLRRYADARANNGARADTSAREVGPGRGKPASAGDETAHDHLAAGTPALRALCEAFRLSSFERGILLLCAGRELDFGFAPLCAAAQGDSARSYPTFGLALAALPDAHWSALAPDAPLRRWRLVEVESAGSLTLSPIRIDERVLHYLTGVSYLDQRLAAMVEMLPRTEAGTIVPSHAEVAERMAAALSAAGKAGNRHEVPVVQLVGPDPAECRLVAAAAADLLRLRAAALPIDLVPGGGELDGFLRLWEREAALGPAAMLLLEFGGDDAESAAAGVEDARARGRDALRLVHRFGGLLVVADREPHRFAHRPSLILDVRHPLPEEQRIAWQAALGGDGGNVASDALAAQYDMSLPAIRSVAAEALALAPRSDSGAAAAWDLCRSQLRARLEGLAQRIESGAAWDDLVLPEGQKRTLRQIVAQVRHRTTVYLRWGFAARSARGLGIGTLFAGPSGTGKTMAAEVLARELRLDLYRIDLSQVVSKYIGETEKNLRRVFDAAEASGAILLFDEADALFGKRSEVKDSHDRYANIEVSYLLQRMEAYRGLAVLTTNNRSALDQAFLRRLRFVVQFPFPDVSQRAEIWKRIFPAATPTEALDTARLAQLNIAGGNIRNIAMNAAFLAAAGGEPVRMRHLLAAARTEYEKIERVLPDVEIAGWE